MNHHSPPYRDRVRPLPQFPLDPQRQPQAPPFQTRPSLNPPAVSQSPLPNPPTPTPNHDPSANWPPAFYHDFTSRVWLTYRSQFSIPIRDIRLGDLSMSGNWEGIACPPAPASLSASTGKRTWPWGGGGKTWNSDSGWGCMLRTGQSLPANLLVHTHLGRGMYLSFHPSFSHLIFLGLETTALSYPYGGLRHICPNPYLVLRYAFARGSFLCPSDGSGWEGARCRCRAVVWTECSRWRNQVSQILFSL